ncbi:MAG: PP2C family protein-serine/threonine phosphatase, partial [Betaproteobacteria bacterium]
RDVSGDLYDFFKLDADRLFFLVGDVSGKGLAACMFMAVSKALYKSAALRLLHAPNGASTGDAMRVANSELSRDNAGLLFVTVFSGVLNLVDGRLEYSNAGHDAPSLLRVGASGVQSLQAAAGPPLCAVEDFPYVSSVHDLRRDDILVMVTDGVPEAMDASGQLYGRQRLLALLSAIQASMPIAEIASHIHDDVRRFVGNAEPSDDLAVMVLQWHGA